MTMEPGKYYHVYTHANGWENLFSCDENYRYFLSRYEHYIPRVADTLAWCLMPNHIHLLIRVKPETELIAFHLEKRKGKTAPPTLQGFETLEALPPPGKLVIRQFSHLFNAYTQAFNKMYKRRGSLFIHSFKRKEIDSDAYFTRLIHYIHTNPARHGFVTDLTDWHWSSWHGFLLPDRTPAQQEVIDWFGSQAEFIRSHLQPVNTPPVRADL